MEEINWKEFSKKLLFEGMIPAAKMITDATENTVDDTVINVFDQIGKYLLEDKAE